MKANLRTWSVSLWPLLLAVIFCLSGCRTSRKAEVTTGPVRCLSAKVRLTVPHKGGATLTVNGTLKLRSGERMQLSFLMPILRTEVARLDITPDEAILVDRMGKRYVQATREELETLLPRNATFARLEKLLFDASLPGAKRTLSGQELGIPSLAKGEIELYDFSDEEIILTPTQLSSRYKQVSPEELLELLLSL